MKYVQVSNLTQAAGFDAKAANELTTAIMMAMNNGG